MNRWHQVAEWLKDSPPALGAEIGVKEGRFMSHLLHTYPGLTMYAVDPWESQPGQMEDYLGWNWSNIYTEYRKKTALYRDRVIELKSYSSDAVDHVHDHSLDFVFIDAQHDYNSVKDDIELWRHKIKLGGLLCGHDYQPRFPGVIQAVNESFKNPILGSNDTWATIIQEE